MYLKTLFCLYIFGATLAIKIDIEKERNLDADLKNCLVTVTERLCSQCITRNLFISDEQTWEIQALNNDFSESKKKYAAVVYSMNHPGYDDSFLHQIGLYLANTEDDLKMTLEHLREPYSKDKSIVWVNYYCGRSLVNYLKETIPKKWKPLRALNLIFVALIKGEIQVLETKIQSTETLMATGLKNLTICNPQTNIKSSELFPKVNQSSKFIVVITMKPTMLPYTERRTDNPGGYMGKVMDELKSKLHFTPEYIWDIPIVDYRDFIRAGVHRIAFDLMANPKDPEVTASSLMMTEGVWVIVTPSSLNNRNFLVAPFKRSFFLQIALLATITILMVYFSGDRDKIRITVRLFGMFLGVGQGWMPRKELYRFLILLWCLTSYVLVQMYLASLTSDLSALVTNNPFHDVNDVIESGIQVLCTEPIINFHCHLGGNSGAYMCKKCKTMTRYIFQDFYVDAAQNRLTQPVGITIDTEVAKSHFANLSMTILRERIGTWPAMIYSNMHSEFMVGMRNVCRSLTESGISRHWLNQYHVGNLDTHLKSQQNVSNMLNLEDSFAILYFGWSCSVVVFIIEISMKWYRKV